MAATLDLAGGVGQKYASNATMAVTKPTVVTGDIWLIMFMFDHVAMTIGPPAGWTQVDTNRDSSADGNCLAIYSRTIDGSEGTTASFTSSGNTGSDQQSFSFRAQSGLAINAANGSSTSVAVTPAQCPSGAITTTVDGCLLVWVGSTDFLAAGVPTFTSPAGYSAATLIQTGPSQWCAGAIATKSQATAGTESAATGTATLGATTGGGCGILFAISPAITTPQNQVYYLTA